MLRFPAFAVSLLFCAAPLALGAQQDSEAKQDEAAQHAPADERYTAEEALWLLKAGNARYRSSHAIHPHQGAARRQEISTAQHPFAQVLTCSDSRVTPEIIFDEGLGDLFVVRVAGNIVDDAVRGTIEYGAEHLDIPLVVVLGHQNCGAVTAAVKAEEAHDHILNLMDHIFPAVVEARQLPGDLVANAVRLNVERGVEELRASWPTLYRMSLAGKIRIVGAVYSLDAGKVEWLDIY